MTKYNLKPSTVSSGGKSNSQFAIRETLLNERHREQRNETKQKNYCVHFIVALLYAYSERTLHIHCVHSTRSHTFQERQLYRLHIPYFILFFLRPFACLSAVVVVAMPYCWLDCSVLLLRFFFVCLHESILILPHSFE